MHNITDQLKSCFFFLKDITLKMCVCVCIYTYIYIYIYIYCRSSLNSFFYNNNFIAQSALTTETYLPGWQQMRTGFVHTFTSMRKKKLKKINKKIIYIYIYIYIYSRSSLNSFFYNNNFILLCRRSRSHYSYKEMQNFLKKINKFKKKTKNTHTHTQTNNTHCSA